ncbi:MAG: GNAT family N-acetyltransferase [Gammaproteobacteria bacterium]|nr:GNAT family N-acetyltransferase [Gammaproteobacteria bacterium]
MTISTGLDGVTLRDAEREDVPLILDFIKQLADYEKLLDEVVATAPDLEAALFGEEPVIRVVIGQHQGEPVGFALFFYNFSTFLGRRGIYLEDLFVVPEHRGAGVGRALLTYLAHLAQTQGCGRLEWSVLNWNEPSIQFYRSLGAVPMDGWTVNRIDGPALASLSHSLDFD